jgi:hypothetical protein
MTEDGKVNPSVKTLSTLRSVLVVDVPWKTYRFGPLVSIW